MDTHQRVIIVGGGALGVSAALALARDGYTRVELLETGRLGEASTALAAGVLSLHTWNDADAQLIHRTRGLVEELVEWGRTEDHPSARTAWRRTPGVTIVRPERRNVLESMFARMRRLGEPAELLTGDAAASRLPDLIFSPEEWVLYSVGEGVIESTDLVDLARRRARQLGVRLREGLAVESVAIEDAQAVGVKLRDGRSERADHVVVAAGPHTRSLLAINGIPVPALPYRTQLAALDLPGASAFPIIHDTVRHFYARPESATRFLAGDGTQLQPFDPDRFDRAADTSFIESLAGRLLARLRRGGEALFRKGWAGLCVGTPDRRPLVGAVAGVLGLHLLTGDNGFGLMRSLALGELLSASVQGKADPRLEAVSPQRFGPSPPAAFPLSEGFSLPD